jgi:hypothetical protein
MRGVCSAAYKETNYYALQRMDRGPSESRPSALAARGNALDNEARIRSSPTADFLIVLSLFHGGASVNRYFAVELTLHCKIHVAQID